jgi:hypothetical protein
MWEGMGASSSTTILKPPVVVSWTSGVSPLGLEFVEMGEKFVVYRTDGKTPLVWPEGELVSELLVCSGVEEGELIERGWVKVGEG